MPDTDLGFEIMSMGDKKYLSKAKMENDIFRFFIETMVEEIVVNDKPFDLYKEQLKRLCTAEGVDYDNLECDLEDFIQTMQIGLRGDPYAGALGMAIVFKDCEECYVSEEKVEEICEKMANFGGKM